VIVPSSTFFRNLSKSIKNIKKRQLEFLGHILRKDGMENLCITGFVDGKRNRGRQRITFLDSLCKWMYGQAPAQNLRLAKLWKTARDRREWNTMITNALMGMVPKEEEQQLWNVRNKSLPMFKIYQKYALKIART